MSPLLEIRKLHVDRRVRVLDGVDLDVEPAQTVGLVGASGAGKSTLAAAVLGLLPIAGGAVRFDGRDLAGASRRQRRTLAGDLQAVFQDPYSSLNPARRIFDTLAEPLRAHGQTAQLRTQVEAALERVGLDADAGRRHPIAFSGGQRQRIAIARALMLDPRLVILDEPVSALDVSIQAQLLNLLVELQAERGLSYLFISHDRDVVEHMTTRVVTLRDGRTSG